MRAILVPDSDEIPMDTLEVADTAEITPIISVSGSVNTFRMSGIDATEGHWLCWGDGGQTNTRATDIARAHGAITESEYISGDLIVVGPESKFDVSDDALREVVFGHEYDIDWTVYGARSPGFAPLTGVLERLRSESKDSGVFGSGQRTPMRNVVVERKYDITQERENRSPEGGRTVTEPNAEKFLPDLARSLACGILVAVGVLAIASGSVFLLNGVFQGVARPDLIFFGAVACAGIISCAGAIFLGNPRAIQETQHDRK